MKAWDALFDGIPEHLAAHAVDHFRDAEVPAGTVLMDEGEDDPSLIYILHGGVSVRKAGREIDTSGPGNIIGEMSLFRPKPRSAQIVTVVDTRALLLDKSGYEEMIRLANPVAYRIERIALEQLGQRLRRLDGLVAERADGQPDPYAAPPRGFFDLVKRMFGGSKGPQPEPREIDPVRVLEASTLFKDERFTYITALVGHFHHTVWAPGEIMCQQGEGGDAVHIIAVGKADVVVNVPSSKREPKVHRMGTVGPGAAVGMTSLLDGRPRMATVVAREQVDALSLSAEGFRHLVEEDSQISASLRRAMIRAFSDQVAEAGDNLLEVSGGGEVPDYMSAGMSMEVYTS